MNINGNNNWRKEVYRFVEKAELKQALNKVVGNQDAVIQLRGKLSKLERDAMLGIIDFKDENLERNNIVKAILLLCAETQEDYPTTYQQIEEQKPMNKYQNLSKSDVANVLLAYLKDINPTNRPFIAVLQNEVQLAQKELQYSKLQSQLEQLASASVSPNVNNFHDAVFKSNYDGWVKSTIEILTKYIEIIDKHSTNNELPSANCSN